MSERVFVDSSAYYALADPRDGNHATATTLVQRFGRQGNDLYTSNFVVAEVYGLILNRVDRDTAEQLLDRLYGGATRIIRASEADETRAREIVHRYRDKDYSLVDAISFAVMQRLHIRLDWTYDQHFAQFGFTQAG